MDRSELLCEILGCDIPLLSAGMGGVARHELVSAVAMNGAYGTLGMVREHPAFIEDEVLKVRQATQRNFGINLVPAATKPKLLQRQIDRCIDLGVHSVTLFWDVDEEAIRILSAAGMLVLHQVGSARAAEQALTAGAKVIIAQGVGAGGHVWGMTETGELISQLRAHFDCLLVAAGGIATCEQAETMIHAGADGVMVGTALLATDESYAHDFHKAAIIEGTSADTFLTEGYHHNWPDEAKVRVLSNTACHSSGILMPDDGTIIATDNGRDIPRYSTESPLKSTHGLLEQMALYAGTGTDFIFEVVSVAERIEAILPQYFQTPNDNVSPSRDADTPPPSSPVCYANEADDVYMGYASQGEIAELLELLLEAERAGARVAALTSLETAGVTHETLIAVHADERRYCRLMVDWLHALGVPPHDRTGTFFEKAMAIEDIDERLRFLNRGQSWVMRKIHAIIPKVRNVALRADLQEMLDTHKTNIAETAKHIPASDISRH